jgi:hypothetical protein
MGCWFPLLLLTPFVCACADQSQRRSEDAAVQHQVSAEIARICALTEPGRQAEIERVRKESGMAIVCPNR